MAGTRKKGRSRRLTTFNLDRYSSRVANPYRDRLIPDLVSLAEAADIMGVSRQAAHRMVIKGQLHGAQVGGTWVFRKAVVEQMPKHRKD
jgi:excisionase family DNA binding protein